MMAALDERLNPRGAIKVVLEQRKTFRSNERCPT